MPCILGDILRRTDCDLEEEGLQAYCRRWILQTSFLIVNHLMILWVVVQTAKDVEDQTFKEVHQPSLLRKTESLTKMHQPNQQSYTCFIGKIKYKRKVMNVILNIDCISVGILFPKVVYVN